MGGVGGGGDGAGQEGRGEEEEAWDVPPACSKMSFLSWYHSFGDTEDSATTS